MAHQLRVLCEYLNEIMLKHQFSKTECKQESKSSNNGQSANMFRYFYVAPVGDMIPVEMVCVMMGQQLMIHCCVHLPSNKLSSVISASLPKVLFTRCYSFDKRRVYNNFVSNVVHKLLTNLRRALGLPDVGTLQWLPHEIKLLIMSSLDVTSVLSLSGVNREFYTLAQDEQLWKHIYIKHYGKLMCNVAGEFSWKKKFIEHHKIASTYYCHNSDQRVPQSVLPSIILPPPSLPFLLPYTPPSSSVNPRLDYYPHHLPTVPSNPFSIPPLTPAPSPILIIHDQVLLKEGNY